MERRMKTSVEIIEMLDEMENGEMRAVYAHKGEVELAVRGKDAVCVPVEGQSHMFVIVNKQRGRNVRQAVLQMCEACGFEEERVEFDVKLNYLRVLVYQYNAKTGRAISVKSREDGIYIKDEIARRRQISTDEFQRILMQQDDEVIQPRYDDDDIV